MNKKYNKFILESINNKFNELNNLKDTIKIINKKNEDNIFKDLSISINEEINEHMIKYHNFCRKLINKDIKKIYKKINKK